MNTMTRFLVLCLLTVSAAALAEGQVIRDEVPGITNLARIESTVACAGAITPESVAAIRDMGFRSIVNLRLATEQGANVDAEEAAARQAGITYLHLPFNTGAPDTSVVDRFITAMAGSETQPAFVHCAGGGRAAAMWFAKRVAVDGWDRDRAMSEATDLGLSSDRLRTFMLDYLEARGL
jgi:uncharacterized protein (TIGR01244 family)